MPPPETPTTLTTQKVDFRLSFANSTRTRDLYKRDAAFKRHLATHLRNFQIFPRRIFHREDIIMGLDNIIVLLKDLTTDKMTGSTRTRANYLQKKIRQVDMDMDNAADAKHEARLERGKAWLQSDVEACRPYEMTRALWKRVCKIKRDKRQGDELLGKIIEAEEVARMRTNGK